MLIWINMLSFPGNLLPTESCSRCLCRRRRWHRSQRSGVFRLERKANRFIGTMRLSKRCTFYLRISECVRGRCVCVVAYFCCIGSRRRQRCVLPLLRYLFGLSDPGSEAWNCATFVACRLGKQFLCVVQHPPGSASLSSPFSSLSHPALPSSYSYSSIQCEAPSPCLY